MAPRAEDRRPVQGRVQRRVTGRARELEWPANRLTGLDREGVRLPLRAGGGDRMAERAGDPFLGDPLLRLEVAGDDRRGGMAAQARTSGFAATLLDETRQGLLED